VSQEEAKGLFCPGVVLLRLRLTKIQCDGENCSSCAKENIKCVMDLDTDQRRQINRNNRNTRDKLPDNLLSALRTASPANAESLLKAIRENASSHRLESLIDELSEGKSDSTQAYEIADFAQTPTDSEGFDERRPSFAGDYALQEETAGLSESLQFGSVSAVHVSLGASKADRLTQVMLSFKEAALSQIVEGASVRLVLSLDGLELDLFFRDRTSHDLHTISTWACEFAKSWTSLLPVTQLALIYFAGAFMRWFILPCRQTYTLMSPVLQPMDGNSVVHDFSEIDYCRGYAAGWIENLTQNTQHVSWPYAYVACLEEPVAGMAQPRKFSKLFMDYCDDPANWTRSTN
jgi:hypothetical protein